MYDPSISTLKKNILKVRYSIFQHSSPTRRSSREKKVALDALTETFHPLFFKKKKKTVSKETDHKNPHKSVMLHEFRSGISPPLSESAGFVVMAKRVVSRDQRGSSLIRNRVV